MNLNHDQIIKICKGKELPEIRRALCGKKIGEGAYRRVYVLKQNKEFVIKIEKNYSNGDFANVMEWRNWVNNRDWKFLGPWLAPCEMINETGTILIQRRVYHRRRKDYPTHIPVFLTDTKLQNFGWIGEQFVCCDYAFLPLSITGKSMKRARWWGTLKHLK